MKFALRRRSTSRGQESTSRFDSQAPESYKPMLPSSSRKTLSGPHYRLLPSATYSHRIQSLLHRKEFNVKKWLAYWYKEDIAV